MADEEKVVSLSYVVDPKSKAAIEATVAASERLMKSMKDVAAAANASNEVILKSSESLTQQSRLLNKLEKDVDPVGRAYKSAGAELARLNGIIEAGGQNAERARLVLTPLVQKVKDLETVLAQSSKAGGLYNTSLDSSKRFVEGATNTTGKWTQALFLNRIGLLELQAAGVNTFQAIASGMSVTHVAMMEGAQVIGAYVQGSQKGFGGLISLIFSWQGAVVTAGVAIGASLAAVITRMQTNENLTRRFNTELGNVGNTSNTTSSGLVKLSYDLRAVGVSASDAEKSIALLIRNLSINLANPSAISNLSNLGLNVGARLGISEAAGIERLNSSISAQATGIAKLGLETRAFTADEAAAILIEAAHGNGIKVTNDALRLLDERLSGEHKKALSDTTIAANTFTGAWNNLLNKLADSTVFKNANDNLISLLNNLTNLMTGPGSFDWGKIIPLVVIARGMGINVPTITLPNASSIVRPATEDDLRRRSGVIGPNQSTGGSLQALQTANVNNKDIQDLNQAFAQRVNDFLNSEASNIIINSAARFGTHPSRFNAGGTGLHNADILGQGLAVDLGNLSPEAASRLKNFGLHQTVPGDWGHIEPIEIPSATQATAADRMAAARSFISSPGGFRSGLSSNLLPNVASDPDVIKKSAEAIAENKAQVDNLNRASKDATLTANLWGIQQQAQTAFTSKYNEVLAQTKDKTDAWDQANIEFNKTRDVGLINLQKNIDLQDKETQGVIRTADAFKISQAAGFESIAMEQARIKVFQQGGGDVEKEKRVLLEASAREAVLSSQQQVAAAIPQLAMSERITEAARKGAAAQHEAEIQAQAAARTQDVLAKAEASRNPVLIEQAKNIHNAAVEEIRRSDAAKQGLAIQQEIRGQRDQQQILQLELSLQGQSNEEITRRVTILQAALSIQEKFPGEWNKDKQALLDTDAATADWVKRLSEARQAQGRIDEGIRSIADTINNTLTKTITDAFDGKKVTNWGATIKSTISQLLSSITSNMFLKPLTGTILSALGLGSAASSFGTFGNLFGGTSSNVVGQVIRNSDGTFSLSNIGSGISGLGKVSDLFSGSGGIFSSGGLFGSQGALFGTAADVSIAGGGAPLSLTSSLSAAEGLGSTSGFLGSLGLGSILGIGGAAIGGIGLLGSLLGWFDSKPKNQLGGANVELTTGRIVTPFSGGSSANDQAANQIANTLSSFAANLIKLTGGTIGPGGTTGVTVGTNTGITINDAFGSMKFGTDSARAISTVELQMAKRLEGVSETVKKVVDTITDPSQIEAALQFASVYDNLKKAADSAFSGISSDTQKLGPFASALEQIKTIFQGLTDQANLYGLSLDPIMKGLTEAKKRLQDDFVKSINDAILAIEDPVKLLVRQEKEAGKARLDDAIAIGASEVEVNKLNSLALEKIWKDQTATLQTLEDNLKTGALSGLTIAGQLKAANDNFIKELKLVQGGSLAEIENLAKAGTDVLSLSQTAYGNAPQTASIRADVLKAVDEVLSKRSFASGTDSTPPGMILVGEHGPEWMRQSGGNKIFRSGDNVVGVETKEVAALLKDVLVELRVNNSISREHGSISERGFVKVVSSLDKKKLETPLRTKVA